ncbi:hypothetical protein AOQ84DRAFT_353505 [Glonium stellatum]|uniref:Uncharacterized protein n=1 Tax=Glonium stellatum TaxID=574774 RepID=A0A8E2F4W7_9PEZI|nr:hypothetical protein AOQ84DRAFT_353505 [Glonium stellatum]
MVGVWSYDLETRDEVSDPWTFMLYDILCWLLFGFCLLEKKLWAALEVSERLTAREFSV